MRTMISGYSVIQNSFDKLKENYRSVLGILDRVDDITYRQQRASNRLGDMIDEYRECMNPIVNV